MKQISILPKHRPHAALAALLVGLAGLISPERVSATVYSTSQMVGFSSGNLGAVGTSENWAGIQAYCTVTSGSGSLDGSGVGLAASAGDKANITAVGTGTYLQFASSGLNQTANRTIYVSVLYRVNTTNGISL